MNGSSDYPFNQKVISYITLVTELQPFLLSIDYGSCSFGGVQMGWWDLVENG